MTKSRDTQIDFQLDITVHGDGYRAYAETPMGEGSADFRFPLSPEDLDDFQNRRRLYRLRTRGVRSSAGILLAPCDAEILRDIARAESGLITPAAEPQLLAEQLGRRLFDAVFVDEVYGLFHSCWLKAKEQNARLVTKLVIRDDPKLEALPWEFLFASNVRHFLATSYHNPIVRYMPLNQPPRPLRTAYPLHVLVVLAVDAASNLPEASEEWHDIRRLLEYLGGMRRFNLKRLNNPTRQELDNWLSGNPCHILHFIGHGEVDVESGKSFLLMKGDHPGMDKISGVELGTLLANYPDLRVVILNTCLGATISSPGRYQSLSQSIASANIPAVLGMNDEITDSAARRFSSAFYDAIARRAPVDMAAAKARMAIYNHDADALEWGTPVLYLRSPDGYLFDLKKRLPKLLWWVIGAIVILAVLIISTDLPDAIMKKFFPPAFLPPEDIQITEVTETSFICEWADPGGSADSFLVELLLGMGTVRSFSVPGDLNRTPIDSLEPDHCYIFKIQSARGRNLSTPAMKSDACTKKLLAPTITGFHRTGDYIVLRIGDLPSQIDSIIPQLAGPMAQEWVNLTPDFISPNMDSIRISRPISQEIEEYRLKVLGPFGTVISPVIQVASETPPIRQHMLLIDVEPMANSILLVDGRERPIGQEFPLPEGMYELEIDHPDYPIFRKTIDLDADLARTFDLKPSGPEINIIIGLDPKFEDCRPAVILNGRERQIRLTPDDMPFISIYPGLWEIEFMVLDPDGRKVALDSVITFPYSDEGPRVSIPVSRSMVDFGDPKWHNLTDIRLTIF